MRQLISPLVFVVLASMFGSHVAWAQHASATPASASPSVSENPYTRYAMPEECSTHMDLLEQRFWRDQRPDTITRGPWGNPRQRNTIAEGRRCVARFAVATVPVRDLLSLGRAYLGAELDAQADSAFRRLVLTNKAYSVEEQGWALVQIVIAHVQAAPIRLAGALRYAVELDNLGARAASSQMMAHTAIASAAALADSVPLQGVHALAAVAAGKQMKSDERRQRTWDEYQARRMLIDWYARRAVFDSARMAARAIDPELSPGQLGRFDWIVQVYDWVGSKAVARERTWTFNNPDSATFPAAGKPTLFVFASPLCGDDCFDAYTPIRRLAAKYGSAGLRIVIPTRTRGFWGDHLMAPQEEAEKTRWYFLDYLKLPVTVDVFDTKFTFRDDGRRMDNSPPGIVSYFKVGFFEADASERPSVVLIDRQGIIRMGGTLNAATVRRFDNLLAEMQ